MEKAIDKYIKYLTDVKHYSDKTTTSYYCDLHDFFTFIVANNIDYNNVIDKDIHEYINHLKVNNYKVSSINRRIVSLRNFYKYYINNINELANNPMVNYTTLKAPKRLPKDLFEEQIKVLLTINEKKPHLAIRNQCIILLLLNTGMRVSELTGLSMLDLDLSECCIRVFGKGRKERIVFFMPSVVPYLNAYINESRNILLNNHESTDALFIGSKGGRITDRAVENILNDRAKQATTPFKVTPHMLRHTFATNLLNNDVDLKMVQELLGHASLSTTQIYTHVTSSHLKKVYENTHPVAKKINDKEKEK